MNKKYIIILIILTIISISAVNAVDNETVTATTNTDDVIAINNQDIDENIISIESNNENNNLSADDDVGTFTDLKNAIDDGIDNGVVNLDKDYKFTSADVSYKEGISLSENGLTINGNNHIIDGDSQATIFHIYGSNIILKDIIFTNGLAKGGGSALGGQSGVSNGGAIYIDADASATITNSTFSNNAADKYGGAIYGDAWAGSLEVSDSTFTSNSASSGGAIYWGGLFEGITISNSKFDSNAAGNGAALWVQTSDAEITDSIFTNNVGRTVKSSISIRNADSLTLSNNTIDKDGISIIAGNIISETNLLLNSETNDGETVLTASLFDDNNNIIIVDEDEFENIAFVLSDSQSIEATDYNNGVWSATATLDDGVKLVSVKDKPFEETNIVLEDEPETDLPAGSFTELQNLINNADGELNLDKDYTYDAVNDRELTSGIIINKDNLIVNGNNHILDAINQVRILYINATNIVLNDIVFANANQKTASRDADNIGGAIYIEKANTKIINSTFINNTAKGNGGALYSYYADNHQIINSTFINNTAKYGGAIYLRTSYNVQIVNTSFVENKATNNDGGAIATTAGNNLNIVNSEFVNNTASNKGGSIFTSGSDLKVFDSNFSNNNAASGGAIYVDGENSEIANSKFINSTASSAGGAIFINEDNGIIHNSTFINSLASSSGGAINIASGADNSKVYNSTFINSTASRGTSGSGGAINVGAQGVEISDSTFINSKAGNYGGVIAASGTSVRNFVVDGITVINSSTINSHGGSIYYTGNKEGKILNSLFINSTSPTRGGVIYWLGTYSDNPSIFNSTFINASSKDGGVAYISNKEAIIKDSTFINSTAENGGVLYLGGSDDEIINSTFTGNSAVTGGAIYATGSPGTLISNSTFEKNNATAAGVLYITNSESLTVSDSTFINNNATANGGVAYWDSNLADVSDSKFFDNYAGNNGGALYLNGNLFNRISGNDFTNNSAEVNGGAIYWKGSSSTNNDDGSITDSSFINNTAVIGNGGAVYWDGGYTPDYTIATSNFINNIAALNGGALYLNKYRESVITESIFESNTALNGTGGAVYVDDSWGLSISQSEFIKNNASENGGALYIIDTTHPSTRNILSFDSNKFEENTAFDGAAIYFNNITDAEISDSEFTNNNASEGNVVSSDAIRYALTVSNNIFNGNVSKVAIYSPNELKLNKNILNDNTVIYLTRGGDITTETHIIVLNNETYRTDLTYVLNAVFTDDNNNSVVLDDSFGKVTFILNDEEVTATQDENGKWTSEYAFNDYGEYNVSAVLNDFKNSIVYNGTLKVEVILPSANVTVKTEDIDYGGNATVEITLNSSARGNIIIYLGDELYEIVELSDNVNGNINVNITDLNVGDYSITVKYSGDDNYEYDSIDKTFTVNKINPTIIINADDITIGEIAEIIVGLPEDATGNLTVTVNNTEYNVTNLELIQISDLAADTYEITVKYAGDTNYNSAENKTEFKVTKKSSGITIDVEESILVNKEATITVSVTEGATGTVNININGTIKQLDLTQSNSITIPFNTPGELTINATYLGDDNYDNATSENKVVTVIDKIKPTIKINVDTQVYAEEEVQITIETDGYNATVTINNEKQEVTDGKIIYIPQIHGVYLIDVQTSENDTYYAGHESKVFTAIKDGLLNPTIEITPVKDVYVGEDVKVIVNTNTDGDINITVNGINVENNTAFTPETDGIYIIIVKTGLSNRYNGGLAVSTFKVNKKPSQINITVDETLKNTGDKITIKVNTTATTGIVLINVNNEQYVLNIEINKKLTITLPEAGEYIINATFAGNEEYESSEVPENIIVTVEDKQLENTTIELNNNTIEIPKNATGNATVKVDGKTVYEGDAQNIPELDDLTPGNHIIEIIYSGDQNYTPATKTAEITVPKENTQIKANDSKITEGETATVKIIINSEATGIMIVEVNSNKYYGEITDGEATIEIAGLVNGNYTAEIIYNGDENYNAATNTTNIKVNAKPAETEYENVNITVDAPNTVNNTTTPNVEITLPEDANGNISVYVDGELVNTTSANKTTIIPLENLKQGAHIINVTYSGDEKYAPANEIRAIAIIEETEPATPEEPVVLEDVSIDLTVPVEVNATESVGIVFGLPDGVTGNVTVFVDGVKVSEVLVNESVVDLGNLSVGAHAVEVKYSGDDKYAPASNAKAVLVTNDETPEEPVTPQKEYVKATVNVSDSVKTGETPNVTVELAKDAAGNVSVIVDGKEIANIPVENGTVTVPLNNLTSGAHIIEVKYSGDDKYDSSNTVNAIAVNDEIVIPTKKDTIIIANQTLERVANDNTKAGEKGGDYYVTLKDTDGNPLVNKTVEIAINGVHYYVQTDKDGRAHQQVNIESANVYTYAFAFQGDDEYNAAPLTSTRLTVTKKTTSITAAAKTYKKSATKKYTVTLKTSKNPFDGKTYLASGKKITLKVNGKTYTGKTNSKNQVTFTIKLTKKGVFTAKIKFAGSKIYAASSKSVKITIK